MLNTNYLYIMCHKYSHDMLFEASSDVIMNVKFRKQVLCMSGY